MSQKSWKKLFPFTWETRPNINPSTMPGSLVRLRPKLLSDSDDDYMWRTDKELCDLDATQPINLTLKEFTKFHETDIKQPSPWSVRFAIETLDDVHIGNCIYSFTETNLVYLHTLESNLRAQASFKKSGLTEKKAVARNRYNFIRMEITKSEWLNLVQPIK